MKFNQYKTKRITIRLTQTEHDLLSRLAEVLGRNQSEAIRYILSQSAYVSLTKEDTPSPIFK